MREEVSVDRAARRGSVWKLVFAVAYCVLYGRVGSLVFFPLNESLVAEEIGDARHRLAWCHRRIGRITRIAFGLESMRSPNGIAMISEKISERTPSTRSLGSSEASSASVVRLT